MTSNFRFWMRVFFSLLLLILASAGVAGETEKIVEFSITGSSTTHPPRTYKAEISNPTNGTLGTSSVTLTINSGSGAQPGTLSIRMLDPLVDRGGTAGTVQRFAIDRAGDSSGAASVRYTVTGSGGTPATASDFVGNALPTAITSFAATETTKTISLGIAGKAAPSSTVSYTITLSAPVGANLGTPVSTTAQVQNAGEGTQTIWSISSPNTTVDRGEGGVSQSIDVSRNSGTGAATITYEARVGGPTPASEEDFVPTGFPTGTLNFGELEATKRVTWSLAGKDGAGPAVTYDAAISAPSTGIIGNGSVRLTVTDSGPAENVTLPLRLHVGSTTRFTDGSNVQWAPDAHYVGGALLSTASAIAGTTDDALYSKQRIGGPVKYSLAGLPTGQTYDLRLLFAEIDPALSSCTLGANSGRKMDLYNNGMEVAVDIDPCKAVGYLTAYSRSFPALEANASGLIVLELRANSAATVLPALAGLELIVHEEPATPERLLVFGRAGEIVEDDLGRIWANGDQYVQGCSPTYDGEIQITGTNNPQLYRGRCNGSSLQLRIPIDTSGGEDRTVFLGFSEHTATAVGQRVMAISVEGSLAAAAFDPISAVGSPDRAYRLRQDTTISDGFLDVILSGATAMGAQINNIAVLEPTEAPAVDHVASVGWKSSFNLSKNSIVRAFAPPRGVAESGNSLVVRAVDDTGSTMHVQHGACTTNPSHGLKTDTADTDKTFTLCVQTWDPANHNNSLFALDVNESVVDEFEVEVCEIDRNTGLTINCQPFTVGVRVSRAGG